MNKRSLTGPERVAFKNHIGRVVSFADCEAGYEAYLFSNSCVDTFVKGLQNKFWKESPEYQEKLRLKEEENKRKLEAEELAQRNVELKEK